MRRTTRPCYNNWRQFKWINNELNKYLNVLQDKNLKSDFLICWSNGKHKLRLAYGRILGFGCIRLLSSQYRVLCIQMIWELSVFVAPLGTGDVIWPVKVDFQFFRGKTCQPLNLLSPGSLSSVRKSWEMLLTVLPGPAPWSIYGSLYSVVVSL